MNKKYGWKRDLPDFRDHVYNHDKKFAKLVTLPSMVNLRSQFPTPYDQMDLGSCTSQGAAGVIEFLQMKEKKTVFIPSRLFIYFYERVLENTVNQDSGASIRDSMKVISSMGAPPESMWPYITSQFAQSPTPKCILAAKQDLITEYVSVLQQYPAIKVCLAEGYAVNFGFSVYSNFESDYTAQTGIVTMPKASEQLLGGHAVVIVGYIDNYALPNFKTGNGTLLNPDPSGGYYIVRNSWGTGWGSGGYCYFPYSYIWNPNLCDDFWSVRMLNDTL